jgi:hypothetical protein
MVELGSSRARISGSGQTPNEYPNGEIIATSQGYETKASAEKGIESVKTNAPGAKVEDLSEPKPPHA